jgi:hypothetical protein
MIDLLAHSGALREKTATAPAPLRKILSRDVYVTLLQPVLHPAGSLFQG